MTIFATYLNNYFLARNRRIHYQALSRDCKQSLVTLPETAKEVEIIKAKWNQLREEFSGVYIPSVTFYPTLLQNYLSEKIKYSEYKEGAERWKERLEFEEMNFKRLEAERERELKKVYNNFRELHQNIPEFEEFFEDVERPRHCDCSIALLSAEFEI